ncbi:MAG: phosphotransferase, partial [Anaerolineae bacterium]|nr:phosphotransferase [Anaerolineae bacterium]
TLEWLGRMLGRLHAVGASQAFVHRPQLDPQSFGQASFEYLMESGFMPHELELSYRSLAEDLLARISLRYGEAGDFRRIRTHGDCHPGNILWRDDNYWFVDLDDCRTAPAIQDLWMLLSG